MSFDNARAECNKLKMDLVRAQTPEENMCIQRQIAEQGKKVIGRNIVTNFDARPDRLSKRVYLDGSEQNRTSKLH
jgi:hypothetical protein